VGGGAGEIALARGHRAGGGGLLGGRLGGVLRAELRSGGVDRLEDGAGRGVLGLGRGCGRGAGGLGPFVEEFDSFTNWRPACRRKPSRHVC